MLLALISVIILDPIGHSRVQARLGKVAPTLIRPPMAYFFGNISLIEGEQGAKPEILRSFCLFIG